MHMQTRKKHLKKKKKCFNRRNGSMHMQTRKKHLNSRLQHI